MRVNCQNSEYWPLHCPKRAEAQNQPCWSALTTLDGFTWTCFKCIISQAWGQRSWWFFLHCKYSISGNCQGWIELTVVKGQRWRPIWLHKTFFFFTQNPRKNWENFTVCWHLKDLAEGLKCYNPAGRRFVSSLWCHDNSRSVHRGPENILKRPLFVQPIAACIQKCEGESAM